MIRESPRLQNTIGDARSEQRFLNQFYVYANTDRNIHNE